MELGGQRTWGETARASWVVGPASCQLIVSCSSTKKTELQLTRLIKLEMSQSACAALKTRFVSANCWRNRGLLQSCARQLFPQNTFRSFRFQHTDVHTPQSCLLEKLVVWKVTHTWVGFCVDWLSSAQKRKAGVFEMPKKTYSLLSFGVVLSTHSPPTNWYNQRVLQDCTRRELPSSRNRSFAQLVPGLEMGHPVTVGQSPAYDFSVKTSRKVFFLSPFRAVLSAIHMQVADRPSPDAPSLTQTIIIVQMVYFV